MSITVSLWICMKLFHSGDCHKGCWTLIISWQLNSLPTMANFKVSLSNEKQWALLLTHKKLSCAGESCGFKDPGSKKLLQGSSQVRRLECGKIYIFGDRWSCPYTHLYQFRTILNGTDNKIKHSNIYTKKQNRKENIYCVQMCSCYC